MGSLTKREKILLSIGLCVLLMYGAFTYLITPAFDKYSEKNNLYAQLKFDKELAVNKIASETDVKAIYDKMLEEYNELTAQYPKEMPNQDLDKLITGICLQHNLRPTSLGILPKKTGNEGEEEAFLITVTLKLSVGANYSDLQRFINTINNTAYLQISFFNFSANDGAIGADIDFNIQMLPS